MSSNRRLKILEIKQLLLRLRNTGDDALSDESDSDLSAEVC